MIEHSCIGHLILPQGLPFLLGKTVEESDAFEPPGRDLNLGVTGKVGVTFFHLRIQAA